MTARDSTHAVLLLYATDLLFTSKIGATARAAAVPLAIVRDVCSLRGRLAGDGVAPVTLVIVDLDAEDAVAAIQAVAACGTGATGAAGGSGAAAASAPCPRVLAYVSHVRADLVAAARAAGADQVMARSAFVAGLEGIVRSAGAAEPGR